MSEPTLSLEARVRSLELALTASEQWNVCVCGHHGSAHNSWNKCLVCECPHFGTRREANSPTTGAERFTKHETWGLYWVAWWMDEHQRNGKLGGTLTEANRIVREMIGPLPEGYSYDPDDERHLAADAARTEGNR